MTSARPTDDDAVVTFEEVADELDAAAVENRRAARRLRRLGTRRRTGHSWRDVLTDGGGRDVLSLVAALSRRLAEVAGRLRRGVVKALLAEGVRVRDVADLLGVSHQRVSRIRNDADRST